MFGWFSSRSNKDLALHLVNTSAIVVDDYIYTISILEYSDEDIHIAKFLVDVKLAPNLNAPQLGGYFQRYFRETKILQLP